MYAKFIPAALCAAVFLAGCMEVPYDVVIQGGTVIDGTGADSFTADVGIRGDRIAEIGDLAGADALQTLDAHGLYVVPGFIDVHSHAAAGLTSEERSPARALLAQGITTAFINPDGGGAHDLVGQREDLLEHGLGVNVAQFVPHGAIRQEAMGGSYDREPTAEEMEAMLALVREGMEAGAYGLSTGLFYAPGDFASTDEIVQLASLVTEYDGVHSSHIRDESDYGMGVVAAVEEIIQVSRESGVVGVVSHIKALGPRVWGASAEIIQNIQAARDEGVEVWADQYPYDASATGLTAALVPSWARDGGSERMRERLGDPETAREIQESMAENLDRRGGAGRILFRDGDGLAGRTLEEVALERDEDPVTAAFGIIAEGEAPGIISFNMSEEDIEAFMRESWTLTSTDGSLPTFGEGIPHPRSYGAFPRKIRRYVVEREVLDLPTAIRSMTGASAQAFRISDRGEVRPGHFADLAIFDLERVHDRSEYTDPHQYAEGMVFVLVNGELVVDQEEFTGALPGRVLNRLGADFLRPDVVIADTP